MMSTSDHELHFEVLPHHIRRRSILKSEQHTTLIARKRREDIKFSDLSQTKGKHRFSGKDIYLKVVLAFIK